MPSHRYWEMESRQIEFADVDANTTDVATLLLTEFALVYGNDWWVIPYELPVGTLSEVVGMLVRIHAVPLADDDGGRKYTFTLDDLTKGVARANQALAHADAELVFDPKWDWQPRNDTTLNNEDNSGANWWVYVATVTGVQIFDRAGQYLGTIPVPRHPANIAFSGPDKRTLYITARQGLYRLKMLTEGPKRLGK